MLRVIAESKPVLLRVLPDLAHDLQPGILDQNQAAGYGEAEHGQGYGSEHPTVTVHRAEAFRQFRLFDQSADPASGNPRGGRRFVDRDRFAGGDEGFFIS